MQEQIHGCPIIARHDLGDRKGRIILVDRGGDGPGRFVTAWQGIANGRPDEEWAWGHYFSNALEAHADFRARAKRGY